MKLTPALRIPTKKANLGDASSAMKSAVAKLSGPASKNDPRPAIVVEALAKKSQSEVKAKSLADVPLSADLVKLLADTLNAPLSEDVIAAHKAMKATYDNRHVPMDNTPVLSPPAFEEQLHSLRIKLEAARHGSSQYSELDVQRQIDELTERHRKAQDWEARRRGRALVVDERRTAVDNAYDAFLETFRPHAESVRALADEYERLADILRICAITARNVVHYDLFGSTEFNNMIAFDHAASVIAKQFEEAATPEVRKITDDAKLAYQHIIKI
ncbi:hypothetical protein [Brucella microti]|uniref:hypothetical protein n=1 Tax=Brucella microti TaxID=444163 RepID=UPI00030E3153|nr:hypothetical protein [Brucella microti]